MQNREFFNPGQLTLILSVASECAQPHEGDEPLTTSVEMAVYDMLANFTRGWEPEQLEVIRFCAQECERQKSGALSVSWMVNAWNYAMDRQHEGTALTDELVLTIAEMIEPDLRPGYRTGTVTIRGVVAGTDPRYIASDMAEFGLMLDAYNTGEREDNLGRPLTAQSLYERFEDIHPREDGNGRTGKVIFNWLTGNLGKPQFPVEPEKWQQ